MKVQEDWTRKMLKFMYLQGIVRNEKKVWGWVGFQNLYVYIYVVGHGNCLHTSAYNVSGWAEKMPKKCLCN